MLASLLKVVWPKRRGLEHYMLVAGLGIAACLALIALLAPLAAPYDPMKTWVGKPYTPPCSRHFFGTDRMGRDVFSRVLWGARSALAIASLAVAIAAAIGIPLGLLSGYVGGPLDRCLSLIMDSLYAFPSLIMALAVAAALNPGGAASVTMAMVDTALAISVVYVPSYFRVVRATVLSVRENLYVRAAQALGAGVWSVLTKYVAPNSLAPAIPIISMNFADAILTASGLSFLGVGLPPYFPDWGVDLATGWRDLPNGAWWMSFFPGLMIFLATLAFMLIGDALNELMSPRRMGG